MKTCSMLLGCKSQYYENDYTTKCNLQIQCNPYQITNDIFHRTRTKNPQFVWKHKRLWIAKAILGYKIGAGGIILQTWLQIILQNYSDEYIMVLAQKQKYRSMEQDIKPRDKPIHIWAHYLWQSRQESTVEKRQLLQQMVLGKMDSYI